MLTLYTKFLLIQKMLKTIKVEVKKTIFAYTLHKKFLLINILMFHKHNLLTHILMLKEHNLRVIHIFMFRISVLQDYDQQNRISEKLLQTSKYGLRDGFKAQLSNLKRNLKRNSSSVLYH